MKAKQQAQRAATPDTTFVGCVRCKQVRESQELYLEGAKVWGEKVSKKAQVLPEVRNSDMEFSFPSTSNDGKKTFVNIITVCTPCSEELAVIYGGTRKHKSSFERAYKGNYEALTAHQKRVGRVRGEPSKLSATRLKIHENTREWWHRETEEWIPVYPVSKREADREADEAQAQRAAHAA